MGVRRGLQFGACCDSLGGAAADLFANLART